MNQEPNKSIRERAAKLGISDYDELAAKVNQNVLRQALGVLLKASEEAEALLDAELPKYVRDEDLEEGSEVADKLVEKTTHCIASDGYRHTLEVLDNDVRLSSVVTALLQMPYVSAGQLQRWDEVGIDELPGQRADDMFVNTPPFRTLLELMQPDYKQEETVAFRQCPGLQPGDMVIPVENFDPEEVFEMLGRAEGARLVIPSGHTDLKGCEDIVQVEGKKVKVRHFKQITEWHQREAEYNAEMGDMFEEVLNTLMLTGAKNLMEVPEKLARLDETIDEDLKKLQEEEEEER